LNQAGIPADKKRDPGDASGWMVSVPEQDAGAALRIIIDYELPRISAPGFNDLFQKDALLPTAIQEKTRFMSALCGELQNTLEQDDSILKARVHVYYAFRERSDRRTDESPRSAAVFLKTVPDCPPEKTMSDQAVRELIATGVGGILESNVSVVRTQGKNEWNPAHAQSDYAATDKPGYVNAVIATGAAMLFISGILVIAIAGRKIVKTGINGKTKV
jgi:type III secretory pathway lipoprotein EscJ